MKNRIAIIAAVSILASAALASSAHATPGNNGNGNGGCGNGQQTNGCGGINQGGAGGNGYGGQGGAGGSGIGVGIGQGGSATGGNAHANGGSVLGSGNSSNSIHNANTNLNAQGQQQGQGQAQGQQQSSSSASGVFGSGNSGGNKIEGNKSSTNVSVGGDTYEAAASPVIAAPIPTVATSCRLYMFGGATGRDGAASGSIPLGNDQTCLSGVNMNNMLRVNDQAMKLTKAPVFSIDDLVAEACKVEGMETAAPCKDRAAK